MKNLFFAYLLSVALAVQLGRCDCPASTDVAQECVSKDNETDDLTRLLDHPMTISNLTDGIVHELGIGNFASVIGSSSLTFTLFYDSNDLSPALKKKLMILDVLAAEFSRTKHNAFFLRNLKINFAKLDIRKNQHIRYLWSVGGTHKGIGDAYANFYRFYDSLDKSWSEIPNDMINSKTFMNLNSNQLPTFPSIFMLFLGETFDVLNCIDESEKIGDEKVQDTDFVMVSTWLRNHIRDNLHFFTESPGRPRLPFKESKDGPTPMLRSQVTKEKLRKKRYESMDPMENINWKHADWMAKQKNSSNLASFDETFYYIQFDEQGDSFFKYKLDDGIQGEYDAEIMESLSYIIRRYLAWADSYENLWDDDRRKREDERTNFGLYLKQMDEQLKDMIFSVFDDLEQGHTSLLLGVNDVPGLRKYFEEMIFGYGRSPSSLENYLQENYFSKKDIDKNLDLFERIRDYMRVREEVGVEKTKYAPYFRTLWIKWFAIMADFVENMTRHYLAYLEAHPEEKRENHYHFEPLDVLDMEDPRNFDLLGNYDEFDRRYVQQRKPVIFSNVGMTDPFNYTLDFLVEVCGSADVTTRIRQSYALGENLANRWGGLKPYELPDDLMTKHRLREDSEPERLLSLEQFIGLMERFDDIYLHDFALKEDCSSLFWFKTPYDPPEQQFFRIPWVIGAYDLLQRLPLSSFADTWPSLFIGRKGTNSKLHIDAGATGFWMYLISGQKRWVIYDRAERPFLYEQIQRNSFIAEILALNSTSNERNQSSIHDYFDATYPLVKRANAELRAYEIVQEPGQLLYIPPETPHAVENLDDIVGLAFNIVPRSGIAEHLHEDIHHRRKFNNLEITLRYLKEASGAFSPMETVEPLRITLGEFSAQY
jgi:hypothetical protein